ncbi:hypothetical protein V1281_006825 [Nitrobacteraceae bacterium AZCC 2161]
MADHEDLPHHHYIPVFYLKQWTRDRRLVEFSRQHSGVAKPRHTSPTGTGYEPGLYRVEGLPDEQAEEVERKFFGPVDNTANEALQIHLQSWGARKWKPDHIEAWSTFLTSLLLRVPEHVKRARKMIEDVWLDKYEEHKAVYETLEGSEERDMLTFVIESSSKYTMEFAKRIIKDDTVRKHIEGMRWSVIDLQDGGVPLFTSDRPVVISHGLTQPNGYVTLPISPAKVFVACNTEQQEARLRSMPSRRLANDLNRHTVRYAVKYAWSPTKDRLPYIEEHLSKDAHLNPRYLDDVPNAALLRDDAA